MSQSGPMGVQFPVGSDRLFHGLANNDPAIEGLRGLAALLVMATHYTYFLTPQAGLWGFASTGVDLFFVLSGYVFAPYFFGKPLSVPSHLIRRFFRLYPLYICALLLYVGLHRPASAAWNHFGVHLLMGHTLVSLAIANFYNPAFWSLPPEVEYYLLLPLLAWLSRAHGVGRFRFVGLVVLAIAVHLALVAAAMPGEESVSVRAIATIHIPGVLVEFMLGSSAYAICRADTRAAPAALRLVMGGLVLAGMAIVFVNHVASVDGIARAVPVWIGGNIGMGAALGYALIVSAVASPPTNTASAFSHAAIPPSGSWCQTAFRSTFLTMGELSYGVYLFHNAAPQILGRVVPTLDGMAALLACISITLLMAYATHYTIEKPMRAYGRRLSQTAARSK